jgi:Spy/CpxP family protein refolding chaperone
MKKWIVIAAVLLTAVALTAVLAGGGMRHHRMHGHGGSAEGFDEAVKQALDDLDATDAQKARVLAVKDRLVAQTEKLHHEHEAVHAAFMRAWGSDDMDTAQLHALVDAKLEELRGTLHQVVDGVDEIHDTLTPEQRQRLAVRVKEMHGSP